MIKIKIPSTVSLAKRAGKIASGESAVKDAIRFGRAKLVLLSTDSSANTQKSISDSCTYYNVKCLSIGTMEELGHAIGNSFNAVIAICDTGFANSIEKAIMTNINGGDVL